MVATARQTSPDRSTCYLISCDLCYTCSVYLVSAKVFSGTTHRALLSVQGSRVADTVKGLEAALGEAAAFRPALLVLRHLEALCDSRCCL